MSKAHSSSPFSRNDDLENLLHRARGGDADAVQELFTRYEKVFRIIVRRYLQNRMRSIFDSIDFLQEVRIKLFTGPLPKNIFNSPAFFTNYIALMVFHVISNTHRDFLVYEKGNLNREEHVPEKELAKSDGATLPSHDQKLAKKDEWEAWLRGLKPLYRTVMERLACGFTYREVAVQLDLKEEMVAQIVHRARAKRANLDNSTIA